MAKVRRAAPSTNVKNVMFIVNDETTLDKCQEAYQAEYDRWCWRHRAGGTGFELVRNTSPGNNIIALEHQEIIKLWKSECRDKHDAECWLNTFRGRAAMKAALEAL